MNTFWILFGAGLFTFLACAGIATIITAGKKESPFKGRVLDEPNETSIFDDDLEPEAKVSKKSRRSKK